MKRSTWLILLLIFFVGAAMLIFTNISGTSRVISESELG